jgi:hypothetical protein
LAGEIEAQIQVYIDYLLAHPHVDDQAVIDALKQAGIGENRAFELVIWVPMAFGRAVLERLDVKLPSTFQLTASDGKILTRRRFSDEPVYVEAYRIATALAQPEFHFLTIGSRSAEFQAVNAALLQGSEVKNLVAAEPVVSFPDQSSQATENTRKPWWKFW